jgi:hypothetical protein
MATQFKIGDRVRISRSLNSVWAGEGEVYNNEGSTSVGVLMTSGNMAGKLGGFDKNKVQPLPLFNVSVETTGMQITKIKRSSQKTGLKVYGVVRSTSGKDYNFAYIRRSNFRGWICSCENFFFTMFKKNRNCKHIKFVRQEVGRYASKA